MIRISTTTTAMTSKMWMKPPRVYELTIPSAQRISSTTNRVQSIVCPPGGSRPAVPAVHHCGFRARVGFRARRQWRRLSAARGHRVPEDRDLRERLRDLVGEHHPERLGERHDPTLEELVVVGGQGIGGEIPRDITIAGLVQVRGRRVEAGEKL